MTLEEAIKHAKELANDINICSDCREEHRQLAEWLIELKRYRKITRWSIKLTIDQYNGLFQIAQATKCDCWFSLMDNEDRTTSIFDLEKGDLLDYKTALEFLAESMLEPIEDYGLSLDEIRGVRILFKEFQITPAYDAICTY